MAAARDDHSVIHPRESKRTCIRHKCWWGGKPDVRGCTAGQTAASISAATTSFQTELIKGPTVILTAGFKCSSLCSLLLCSILAQVFAEMEEKIMTSDYCLRFLFPQSAVHLELLLFLHNAKLHNSNFVHVTRRLFVRAGKMYIC